MIDAASIEEVAEFVHSRLASELFLPPWADVPEQHKPVMRNLAKALLEDPPPALKRHLQGG